MQQLKKDEKKTFLIIQNNKKKVDTNSCHVEMEELFSVSDELIFQTNGAHTHTLTHFWTHIHPDQNAFFFLLSLKHFLDLVLSCLISSSSRKIKVYLLK